MVAVMLEAPPQTPHAQHYRYVAMPRTVVAVFHEVQHHLLCYSSYLALTVELGEFAALVVL